MDWGPKRLIVRTSCTHGDQKYVVPNYLHLPADYYSAMTAVGLDVTSLYESGRAQRTPGMPMALILEARKSQ